MEILYCPSKCGTEVTNSRGKRTKIRKYHLTSLEMDRNRGRWEEDIKDVSSRLISLAGPHFFNPYRRGIYHYQIKSLFLLGANKWHSLSSILAELITIMSGEDIIRDKRVLSAWEVFKDRSYRLDRTNSKDYIGKIQENFVFFQRLSQLHPYGYKLRQVRSAIDIKREDRDYFPNGMYSYRLSTYDTVEESIPIRDYSKFTFPLHERKYVNYKFIGTTITKDKKVINGVEHVLSPM